MVAGANNTGNNLAVLPPSSLSGTVYLQTDQNPLQDSNEFGIATVPIKLSGINDLGQRVSASTITDANGFYDFAGLRPGTYTILRGASPEFLDGHASVGSLGGSAKGKTISAILMAAGEQGQTYEFSQRVKPGCVLNTSALHAALLAGPHPTGNGFSNGKTPAGYATLGRLALPVIRHWLPTLAARFGVTSASASKGHGRR